MRAQIGLTFSVNRKGIDKRAIDEQTVRRNAREPGNWETYPETYQTVVVAMGRQTNGSITVDYCMPNQYECIDCSSRAQKSCAPAEVTTVPPRLAGHSNGHDACFVQSRPLLDVNLPGDCNLRWTDVCFCTNRCWRRYCCPRSRSIFSSSWRAQ